MSMKKSLPKNILVCVAGITPQVITEAYYYLVSMKKVKIDELFVLTTKKHKDLMVFNIPNKINEVNNLLKITDFEFNSENILCANEEVGYPGNLDNQESYTTTDLIFDFFASHTNENTKLFCCLSGGRKTMSVDMAMAFSMYAREHDELFHIFPKSDYYPSERYYPKNEIEEQNLIYLEKPIYRLRDKLPFIAESQGESFRELIVKTQETLDDTVVLDNLIIDTDNRTIKIGKKSLMMQPLTFSVYLFFAKSKNGAYGGKNFTKTNSASLWKIYQRVSASQGQVKRFKIKSMQNEIIDFNIVQKNISTIKNLIKDLLDNSPISDYYTISVRGNYGEKTYSLKLPKTKIKILK